MIQMTEEEWVTQQLPLPQEYCQTTKAHAAVDKKHVISFSRSGFLQINNVTKTKGPVKTI